MSYNNTQNTISIDNLYSALSGKSDVKINLEPLYQRGHVWTEEKESFFIESIIIGIVPNPIIFNIEKDGNKICIDGKQRLLSIKHFIEGPTKQNNMINVNYKKVSYNDLDNEMKIHFNNSIINVIEYYYLSYEKQLELFRRIQNGTPLNENELLIAKFNDEKVIDIFTTFVDNHKNIINKFITGIRKEHVCFLIDLMIVTSDLVIEQRTLTKIVREQFIKTNSNITLLNVHMSRISQLIKKTFTNIFFNSDQMFILQYNLLLTVLYNIYRTYCNTYNKLDDVKHVSILISDIGIINNKYLEQRMTKGVNKQNFEIIQQICKNNSMHLTKWLIPTITKTNTLNKNKSNNIIKNKYDTKYNEEDESDDNNESDELEDESDEEEYVEIKKTNNKTKSIMKPIIDNKNKSIPKSLKSTVWNEYIGEQYGIGACYVCERKIDSKHFECGHIKATSKGGDTTKDNLRCICSECNKTMGSKNMNDFKKQYFNKSKRESMI